MASNVYDQGWFGKDFARKNIIPNGSGAATRSYMLDEFTVELMRRKLQLQSAHCAMCSIHGVIYSLPYRLLRERRYVAVPGAG